MIDDAIMEFIENNRTKAVPVRLIVAMMGKELDATQNEVEDALIRLENGNRIHGFFFDGEPCAGTVL